MKKKVLLGLGIIIVVGAVAGGMLFTRGKGEDNTVNAMASIETASTVETEPEESKEIEKINVEESKEIKVEETESESEDTLEGEVTPEDAAMQNALDNEIASETNTTYEETNTDILPLDKVMYSKGEVNTRIGPSTDYTKSPTGPLTLNQEVHVTGQSQSTNWYQLTLPSNEVVYVSDQYLSDTKLEVQQSKPSTNKGEQSNSNQNQGQQQTNNNQQQQQPEQPSTPPTQPQDTPSTGGIESGNLGGDNGFGSFTDGVGSSDWLGEGDNTQFH